MMDEQARRRCQALSACLTLIEANIRTFSRNQAAQEPREGYGAAWQSEKDNADSIREMMEDAVAI